MVYLMSTAWIRAETNQLGRNRVYTHHSVQKVLHLMPKAVREKKIQAQEAQRDKKISWALELVLLLFLV